MSHWLKILVLCSFLVIGLASCVERNFHYLGYTYWGSDDPDIDYNNWGSHYSRYAYIDSDGKGHASFFPTYVYDEHFSKSNNYGLGDKTQLLNYVRNDFYHHEHRYLRNKKYEYAIFCPEGYVSEMDIRELEKTLHDVTKRTLGRMLMPMVEGGFVYGTYSKYCCRILSDDVKKSIMSVKIKSEFEDLGGWQMLKPLQGLDKQGTKFPYVMSYKGDNWYEIAAPFNKDATSVSVKVGFAGKYFNSTIIGLKNEKKGVDVCGTNYDTRYNNKMLTFTPQDDVTYTYMFMRFLCPKVYKMLGKKKLVFDEDFQKAIDEVVGMEKAFVHEFYDNFRGFGNDMRKIIKKYRYQMVQHFAGSIDEQIKKKNYDVEMFLPCSFDEFASNGYTVEYMGEDCFKVTAGGRSVFLKVVLYGNKMTPAIMGMINPSQGIDYCPDRFPWVKSVKE